MEYYSGVNTVKNSVIGITTFFNPAHYESKKQNFKEFRSHLKSQNLILMTVELAFGDEPFELGSHDSDILIQVRSNSILWQKERLLNIALENLPSWSDKIVWMDADIFYKDDSWVEKVSLLLDKYNVVQPYSHVVALDKDGKIPNEYWNLPISSSRSIHHRHKSLTYSVSNCGENVLNFNAGSPGHIWAARRNILEKFSFFDKCVVGGGDRVMNCAFYGTTLSYEPFNRSNCVSLYDWMEKVYSNIQGDVGYFDAYIFHMWHGDVIKRMYGARHMILPRYDFDPIGDIKLNSDGCWEWDNSKIEMQNEIKNYFYARDEDYKAKK